jgi:hypothetical protein
MGVAIFFFVFGLLCLIANHDSKTTTNDIL